MNLQQKLKMIQSKPSLIYHYFIGNFRYKLYYSKRWSWLMRKHIKEQIEFRVEVMDNECFYNGSCKKCGCETIHLQCASKACEKPCYPIMMNKKQWSNFQKGIIFRDDNGTWIIDKLNNQLILIKATSHSYYEYSRVNLSGNKS